MKLTLLTALTLAVLPTAAMADGATAQHVATVTPPQHVVTYPEGPQSRFLPFKNALQFNAVDGQPVR